MPAAKRRRLLKGPRLNNLETRQQIKGGEQEAPQKAGFYEIDRKAAGIGIYLWFMEDGGLFKKLFPEFSGWDRPVFEGRRQ